MSHALIRLEVAYEALIRSMDLGSLKQAGQQLSATCVMSGSGCPIQTMTLLLTRLWGNERAEPPSRLFLAEL